MSEYNLVVQKKVAPVINFSNDEILKSLEETIEKYKNIVVTEETAKGNKKVLAELNAAKKEVETFRKNIKKEMTAPIKDFEEKCKTLVAKIDEAYDPIKLQMENFIEHQRKEKEVSVNLIIEQTKEEIELKAKYLDQIELKDKYMNSSESLNKIKADVVEQFKTLKMLQDMEQMKIDTVNSIVAAYNEKLTFKYSFDDFERYIDEETTVADLTQIVNRKVESRLEEEKAELVRIEEAKQLAVEHARIQAKLDAEREAEEKADKIAHDNLVVEQQKEKEHQDELKRIEKENELKEQKIREEAQTEAVRTTETIVESVSKHIPVEAKEEDPVNDYMLEIKATDQQLEAIKSYLEASGVKLVHVEVL